MKKESAGIVITDGDVVLGCKSYQWDLPKGEIEEGEEPIDAAIRETQEETGLIVKKEKRKSNPDPLKIYANTRSTNTLEK